MKVKIKKLHPDAIVPTYGTSGAACFDLYAIEDADMSSLLPSDCQMPVEFYGACTFRTGLAFEVPEGHVMQVYSRSGHGFKHGVRLSNCTGIIDSDYRGELMVKLHNDGDDPFMVKKGDRIAQAMIVPVNQVSFDVVDELSDTDRGEGGFGSTGK